MQWSRSSTVWLHLLFIQCQFELFVVILIIDGNITSESNTAGQRETDAVIDVDSRYTRSTVSVRCAAGSRWIYVLSASAAFEIGLEWHWPRLEDDRTRSSSIGWRRREWWPSPFSFAGEDSHRIIVLSFCVCVYRIWMKKSKVDRDHVKSSSLEHVHLFLVFEKLFLVGEQVSGHDLPVHCVHSSFILVEKFSKELTRRRFTNTCHGSKTKRKHIVHTHTRHNKMWVK